MSDGSVGPEEKACLKKAISDSPELGHANNSREPGSEELNLDLLIERGDWPGVIAAARIASEDNPSKQPNVQQVAVVAALTCHRGKKKRVRFI